MTVASIGKEFTFSAAHHLDGLPDTHPCASNHGHNYTVTLTITGDTDKIGFVIDYTTLKPFGVFLDETLDHRDLNEVVDFNPTAENLADWLAWVADHALDLSDNSRIHRWSVTVSETARTTATVTHLRSMERNL